MNLHRIPMLRVVLPFIIGILINSLFNISIDILLTAFTALFLAVVFLIFSNKSLQNFWSVSPLTGAVFFLTLVTGGALAHHFSENTNHKNHITREGNYQQLLVRVTSPPQEKPKTYRVTATIEQGYKNDTAYPSYGKLLIYLNKKNYDSTITYGDYLLIKNKLEKPPSAIGKDSFNYANYLANQNIYYQAFLYSSDYSKTPLNKSNYFFYFSFKIQEYFNSILNRHLSDSTTFGLASALILGQRQWLDGELKTSYAHTGTIHILAVSGLHVGAIYLAILFLFSLLPHSNKIKWIKAVVVLFLLWLYAFLTGLSPSVIRATTMFSFITLGDVMGRKTNLLNSLAGAALFTLAFDAKAVFHVGFQLSYLAVAGIGVFYLPVSKLLSPRVWLLRKLWQLLCVSFVAQLATFPLGLYYFHQFPNLFLVSNLFIVPVAMLSVYIGLLLLVVSPIKVIAEFLGEVLSGLLRLNNSIAKTIENIPFSYTQNIQIDAGIVLLLYSVIISFSVYLFNRKSKL